MVVASGRIISSAVHSGGNASKRASSGSTTTTTTAAPTDTLGAAVKLGGANKERNREKEDVELRPPWDLLPYSRDPSAGTRTLYPGSLFY